MSHRPSRQYWPRHSDPPWAHSAYRAVAHLGPRRPDQRRPQVLAAPWLVSVSPVLAAADASGPARCLVAAGWPLGAALLGRDLLLARAHRRAERSLHRARRPIEWRRSSRIKPGLRVQRHPPRHPPRVLPSRQQKRRPGAKSCRSRRGRTQAKRGVCPQAGGCSLASPSS